MSTAPASRVLIVAAEASSSLYALRLLEYWKAKKINVEAFGIGSRAMEAAGFRCLGRSEEMAVVGLQEVLKHLPLIRDVFNSILAEVDIDPPKFALLLDYPDFNLRLAKKLKSRGIKVYYYISPQVWAWRTGRVKTMRKMIERMLVLFPFEEKFYRDHGMKADFVGHPLLDEVEPPADEKQRKLDRSRFGLGPDDLVLGLMPGSRNSEIQHHLETQLQTALILNRKYPNLRVLLMVAPTLTREKMKEAIGDVRLPIQIIKEDPLKMVDLADVVLVASGTATLTVGLMEKPMVIMYRMNSITAWFARKLVTKTPFFGMVNLIMGERVVPELFQEDANPTRLAAEISKFFDDRDFAQATRERLAGLKSRLGSKGATERVAQIVSSELT